MGAGDLNHGAPVGTVYLQNVNPDKLTGGVGFTGDLLADAQNGVVLLIALTDPDEHIAAGIHTQNGAGHQLLALGGVAVVDDTTLRLADALNHHLLGGLGGDAAEFLDVHGDGHGVAHLGVGIDVPGGVHGDFQSQVGELVNHGLDLMHTQAVLAEVHHHIFCGNIPVILPILAVCVGEGLLQAIHHIVHGNPLELFQLPEALEDFLADVHLRCFGLLGFCFSGHVCKLLLRILPAGEPAPPGIFQM